MKLHEYIRKTKIFLDDTTLLCADLDDLLNALIPELRAQHKKLYIPIKAFYNLKKTGKGAQERVNDLQALYNSGLVEFIGDISDVEADDALYPTMIASLLKKYSITFFTQDISLARDIFYHAGSLKNRLKLLSYNRGNIDDYRFEPTQSYNHTLSIGSVDLLISQSHPSILTDQSDCFTIAKQVTALPDKRLDIVSLPSEGGTVYIDGNPIKLGKKLSSGGEGIIYEINQAEVAKIYKKEKLTKRRVEKLKTMVSKRIDFPGICYPKALLTNNNGEPIGFTMDRAKGVELQRSVFVRKLLVKRFPDWTRRDLIDLCITILEKIAYLSEHGIIIGDINPMNILVVSPQEVYFVDTDSYQIEDFPCPVGTVNFTAPEIQGVNFSDFLRTPAHERFAISTLLFMLLLPGKAPYAKRGGESPQQNILSEDFSYPFQSNYNGKIPKGPWGLIWSHLPDALQEAFYHSFRRGECYTRDRISPHGWLAIFREYRKLLDDPNWLLEDKEALEIFPKYYRKTDPSHPRRYRQAMKKASKKTKPQTVCRECKKPFDESELKDGLCKSCIAKKSEERLRELKSQRPRTRTVRPKRRPTPTPKQEVKTLICRKCRKSFPDYEMKGGLCPSCRAQNPDAVPKSGFEQRQEQKEIICRGCRQRFPASQMQGGYCPTCRKNLGIPNRPRPQMTIGNDFTTQQRKTFIPKAQDKMLICRGCHKEFPDSQMKGGLCPNCRGENTPSKPRTGNIKELICRGCHKRFPDYEMKGGLCPTCRTKEAVDVYNPPQERMFRCSSCGRAYPVSELTGGVCSSCRRAQRTAQTFQMEKKPIPKKTPTTPSMPQTRIEREKTTKTNTLNHSKEAKEAITNFFKDVPADELNTFVSWLLKD